MRTFITVLFLLYFSFSSVLFVYAQEGSRVDFLMKAKVQQNYEVESFFVSGMNQLKQDDELSLKDRFKTYRKISKTRVDIKEQNIGDVFTGNNGRSLRKALRKRLHVDDPVKKISGLEDILGKVKKIEDSLVITSNMSLRKKNKALLQLKQLKAIRNLIEIEQDDVYNQLESYYIVYEKDFVESLIGDPSFLRYNSFTDYDFETEDDFNEDLFRQNFIEDEELYDADFEELEGFHDDEN